MRQALHMWILGILCHSSLQILSSLVRLDGAVVEQQISGLSSGVLMGSSQGSGWATQGHFPSCPSDTPELFGCVFQIIVLLNSEPSAQSEVLSRLDQVFKHISVLCSLQLSLNTDESPCPFCWKTPSQFDSATPSFTAGIALGRWWVMAGFLPTWHLELSPNS